MTEKSLRPDLAIIADLIEPNSRLLEVGCAEGDLLAWLTEHKAINGRGMELSQSGVNECVAKGLFVVQGDADRHLADYADDSFDMVVLSKTLQATHRPKDVLHQLLRIGKRAIISIPNFAHWRIRLSLLVGGRMPVNRNINTEWFETDNIHFCTITDMLALFAAEGLTLEQFIATDIDANPLKLSPRTANLLAAQGIFMVSKD